MSSSRSPNSLDLTDRQKKLKKELMALDYSRGLFINEFSELAARTRQSEMSRFRSVSDGFWREYYALRKTYSINERNAAEMKEKRAWRSRNPGRQMPSHIRFRITDKYTWARASVCRIRFQKKMQERLRERTQDAAERRTLGSTLGRRLF